ncbi:MAG: phenylalanine--tRNA ligase subunit beta [Planctomycetota bacterium]|nr:phenylalanine--tRNA ligase subunit beta [Planctomycetota bacterium]
MPKIDMQIEDFLSLIGESISVDEIESRLESVKGELDGFDAELGVLRVELNDTNRPDLWCTEGIARQLRGLADKTVSPYPFYGREDSVLEFHVDPDLVRRPYGGAIVARGLTIDDATLRQIIQTQEKLSENFGHGRASVSIGVYNAQGIEFPVQYRAVDPSERSFVPLGHEESMNLTRILEEHEKGRQYAHLLEGWARLPILEDAQGTVLSFPPIINSRAVGEVEPGHSDLLVETTSTDQMAGLLVLSIFAANLADRGASIESVTSVYSQSTPRGKRVVAPVGPNPPIQVTSAEAEKLLGVPVSAEEMVEDLERMGCVASLDGQVISVSTPAFRDDYLHAVDAIEDCLIARGLDRLPHRMPRSFTAGKASRESIQADGVRDLLIGFGFEEIITNILTNPNRLIEAMNCTEGSIVQIANAYSETYSAVRNQLLPFLLHTERESATALYPHRIFEVGEVAVPDSREDHGSRTEQRVAAMIAHSEATFSEIHAFLDQLVYYLGMEYSLDVVEHPSYLSGRVGAIRVDEEIIGHVGELHPQVLSNWDIRQPTAAFEFTLPE